MKKSIRFLCIGLALCIIMCASAVFVSAAEQTPAPIQDVYVYDGVTYFNINSDYADISSQMFINDCLTAENSNLDVNASYLTAGETTANLWQYIALEIQRQIGETTETGKFRTQFNNVLEEYAKNYAYGTTKNLKNGDNNYNVTASGLQYAQSVASAGTAIEKQLYKWYEDADGSRDQKTSKASKSAVWQNSTLANDTAVQDTFWMAISANKTSGTYKHGHYQALAVVFSEFTLSPIIPENKGNNYIFYSSAPNISNTHTKGVTNDSSVSVNSSDTLSESETLSVTSEVNGSEEISFGQALGVNIKIGNDLKTFVGAEIGVDFTFGQVLQEGWSKSEAQTTSKSYESTVSLTVPPYTAALIQSEKTQTETVTTYNCPVALGFKVTVLEYTLDPSSNSADAKTKVLATYNDARAKLRQYAVTEKSVVSRDGVNWSSAKYEVAASAAKLAVTAPISSTGATLKTVYDSVVQKVGSFAPIYPLKRISAEDLNEVGLNLGEYIYLSDINLKAYNDQKGENNVYGTYYGFNANNGHWVLVDENNNEIGNGNADTPAILETDPVTKEVTLKAQSVGTVYLKYIIDENCYGTVNASDGYATNSSITTAIIKVKVNNLLSGVLRPTIHEKTEDISITVTRDNMIEAIRGIGLTESFAEDEKDGVVTYLLYTDKDDEIINGTRIYQGMVDSLPVGTYYVRAAVNNNYSQIAEVILTDNQISNLYIPNEIVTEEGGIINLANLPVYNQNGADVNSADIEWYFNGEKMIGNTLSLNTSGSFTLYAVSGSVRSNEMVITVTEAVNESTPDEATQDQATVDEGYPAPGDSTNRIMWMILIVLSLLASFIIVAERKLN